MPKYLVEIILVVKAKNLQEARKIADYIIDLPIPDKNIENAIETLRYEEIVQIKNPRA
jgi:MoaA/NifB/PqqE/SkfB family radical SAM enzyme